MFCNPMDEPLRPHKTHREFMVAKWSLGPRSFLLGTAAVGFTIPTRRSKYKKFMMNFLDQAMEV